MTPPARVPPAPLDLRRRLGIETPEHVQLNVELAGLGSRAAAALLDTTLVVLGLMLIAAVIGVFGQSATGRANPWGVALLLLLYVFSFFLYFTLFEALNGGRTPGKRALGLRVVMDTGHPVTPAAAVIRNLVRLLDCLFPLLPFLPGLLLVFLHKSNKRLGDIAAGTIVVRDRPTQWSLGTVSGGEVEVLEPGPPELSDAEYRLLDRFVARLPDLSAELRARTTAELVRRFETRVPRGPGRRGNDDEAYLVELHGAEQRRRASRFGTRARPGSAGQTSVTAERFLARKRDTWEAFYAVARRVERRGVGRLPAAEIPGFAARYREVAADLARARTYGVDPPVIEYLERLVSAGHNALYQSRSDRRAPVARYLLRDFPAAVVASRRYVAAAGLLLAVPALVGFTMMRQRPALGEELMPVMVSRAEQAAENQARGVGYAQSDERDLPVIASMIISNNVVVSFWVFVGGLLAGTLTAWLLVQNGLMLGMGFGLFANYHAASYLATFVAGHGVLELTAICVAAGAGFRLAGALIAPGDRTRRDALVVEGRIAARMIGAVVSLLAIAGTIEGLLSASDAPAPLKYGASVASVGLLFLYFRNGAASLRQSTSGKPAAL